MSIENMNERREVLLIRHGQSTANEGGVWQGQLEFPLSDKGRLQASYSGRALRGSGVSGVYASPLSRAFETAEIVACESGFSGEVVPMPGLIERSGGVLEGLSWAEQEARNHVFVEKFLSLPEEERWTLADAETDEDILIRFKEALSDILSRHPAVDGPIIVVSHGGVMRAFLRHVFGPGILSDNKRAPNASITRLLYGPQGSDTLPRLLELASTDHLPPEITTSPEAPGSTADTTTGRQE
jgi:broad specificity phosphatase PhoE